jgi:hypothetical protein
MKINALGRVIPEGGAMNLRPSASRSGDALAKVPLGRVFWVLDGPVCNDGYQWWQVRHGGDVGWLAEGDSETYYIEPLISTDTPASTVVISPLVSNDVFQGAYQGFEKGYMIWIAPLHNRMFVLFANGRKFEYGYWAIYESGWTSSMGDNLCGKPPGIPVRGFGYLWCNNSTIQSGLGGGVFAEVGDSKADYTYDPESAAQVIDVRDGTFVLYADGSWTRTSGKR